MPYKSDGSDAPDHVPQDQAKAWSRVWNGVYEQCKAVGETPEDCERKAFAVANSKIDGKWYPVGFWKQAQAREFEEDMVRRGQGGRFSDKPAQPDQPAQKPKAGNGAGGEDRQSIAAQGAEAKPARVIVNPHRQEYEAKIGQPLDKWPPARIPKEKIEWDLEPPLDSHPVAIWEDPDYGKIDSSWTRSAVRKRTSEKWDTERKLTPHAQAMRGSLTNAVASMAADYWDLPPKKRERSWEYPAATISLLIAETGMRPGKQEYLTKNGTRGASTLAPDNVEIAPDGISAKIRYVGKYNVQNEVDVRNPVLVQHLGKFKAAAQREGSEQLFPTTEAKALKYTQQHFSDHPDPALRSAAGNVTMKDFRTVRANEEARKAGKSVRPTPPADPDPRKAAQQFSLKVRKIDEHVSKILGNTPASARECYVNPATVDQIAKDDGIDPSMVAAVFGRLYKDGIPGSPGKFSPLFRRVFGIVFGQEDDAEAETEKEVDEPPDEGVPNPTFPGQPQATGPAPQSEEQIEDTEEFEQAEADEGEAGAGETPALIPPDVDDPKYEFEGWEDEIESYPIPDWLMAAWIELFGDGDGNEVPTPTQPQPPPA